MILKQAIKIDKQYLYDLLS